MDDEELIALLPPSFQKKIEIAAEKRAEEKFRKFLQCKEKKP